jgi:uncharacterized protein
LEITQLIAGETGILRNKVEDTVRLLDDGNTIPFISRYRKEATGELDEVQIRRIEELLQHYRHLVERQAEVIRLIDEQGQLNEELERKVMTATKLAEIEDIYRPFRPKRKTRAATAHQKGLGPLAEYLLTFPAAGDPQTAASRFLSEQVTSEAEALLGACDIIAEQIADNPELRHWVREYTRSHGLLTCRGKDGAGQSLYENYYQYQEPLARVAPHRVLAINRGEREGFLDVSVVVGQEAVISWVIGRFVKNGVTAELVQRAASDAYKRLVAPAMEREMRSELTERAEIQAVKVFALNLRNLLLQPPLRGLVLLGVDPAYRTGCKWAVVDTTGRLLEVGVVFPTPPQKKVREASQVFASLVDKYGIDGIVIGNGTASRETEQFVADFLKEQNKPGLSYTIVSEAGASVYSASPLAGQEFPELNVAERSAVSIARRLQDPLAELVKIDPQAVGVGQYQHDIASKRLSDSLAKVVESAVNYVGADLNTASAALLGYVAGISPTVAENVVHYREDHGYIKSREQLKKVPRLGPRAFEQCAGFLRIYHGDNPLEATPIHPESYRLAYQMLERLGVGLDALGTEALRDELHSLPLDSTALQLGAGLPTLSDIIESLCRPGRDPRQDLPAPIFRTDVLSIEDLRSGMQLQGTVRNVVDFGAFVDIGVKADGLVHISELSERYVKDPLTLVAIGDIVNVTVLSVDTERRRIALSMRHQQ